MDQVRIAVIGAGSWGTTMASMLSEQSDTLLWARESEVASAIKFEHENSMFLPGLALSHSLRATVDPIEAVDGRDLVLVAVPVQHLRSTAEQFIPALSANATLLSLAKGIERSTLLRPSQVLVELLASSQLNPVGVLSGPNLAKEVLARQPTASVVAIEEAESAQLVQSALMNEFFRVYTSPDVVGCEIGGAVKNVIAIAAGAASGLGYGWNSLSGLITRGLAELTRLGVALGGSPLTFLGLAGNGDLIATCSSEQSRNRRVGVELGKGRDLAAILSDTDMVAEGVSSTPAVLELARGVGVEMPLAEHVGAMLRGDLSPIEVVRGLMGRAPTSELHGLEMMSGDRPGRVRRSPTDPVVHQIPEAELVREVPVAAHNLLRLGPLIGATRLEALQHSAADARKILAGRTVWNISSTSAGGGVAEMLRALVGYARDAGIDTQWLVISGDPEFFVITKRIHNRLHGAEGDSGDLGASEKEHYEKIMQDNSAEILRRVQPGDIVLLHDPQTAGLAGALVDAGARVVWRCHVGRDTPNPWTDQAWGFLKEYLGPCHAFVFSLAEYVPHWLSDRKVVVIPPSIDPFSSKNEELSEEAIQGILARIGVLATSTSEPYADFIRGDGTTGRVTRPASIWAVGGRPFDPHLPLVIQVSRWDRIKDMQGVMNGFASYVAPGTNAQLALIGPSTAEVSDDSEGAAVLAECVAAWKELPESVRSQIWLLTLPMDDIDENAAMVNALQRWATVIVQKSFAEGFGLTVSEGMWKGKAIIASAVGGIPQQVAPGTGVLLLDPSDLEQFGGVLASLLEDPVAIATLGMRAREHVREGFIGDRHLIRYVLLMQELVEGHRP